MKTPTTAMKSFPKLPAYTDAEIVLQCALALAQVVADEARTRLYHAAWEAEAAAE